MTRITVRPEALRALGAQLQQVAQGLAGMSGRLSTAWKSLDWQARQKAGLEVQVSDVCSRAGVLAAQAEDLGRYLVSKAQAFEEADRAGASGMGQAAAAFIGWLQERGYDMSRWSFPGQAVQSILRLGSIFALPAGVNWTVLPAAGGAGFLGLAPLSALPQTLRLWGECLWNWLHGYGWKTNAQFVSPLPDKTAPAQPKVGFGDLLRKAPTLRPDGSRPATASGTIAQPSDSWWWDVPTRSQHGLKLPDGVSSDYGCVPTAASMILDYWHARDPANKTISAQDLLSANVKQGEFRTGMSPSNLQNDLAGLGYNVTSHVNSTREALKEAVGRGPVIAVVKLGMKSSGLNHSVVVTGISPNNEVRLNDPWDGQAHTYSWEDFSRSWGADFGPNAPKNSFVEISPS